MIDEISTKINMFPSAQMGNVFKVTFPCKRSKMETVTSLRRVFVNSSMTSALVELSCMKMAVVHLNILSGSSQTLKGQGTVNGQLWHPQGQLLVLWGPGGRGWGHSLPLGRNCLICKKKNFYLALNISLRTWTIEFSELIEGTVIVWGEGNRAQPFSKNIKRKNLNKNTGQRNTFVSWTTTWCRAELTIRQNRQNA